MDVSGCEAVEGILPPSGAFLPVLLTPSPGPARLSPGTMPARVITLTLTSKVPWEVAGKRDTVGSNISISPSQE